jgi:CheY-like chemotaxis protein
MGGLEASAAIRARETGAGPRVPILALTAHAGPGDRERCLAAGMDEYLAKPVDIHQLVAVVERMAAGAPVSSGLADGRSRTLREPASPPQVFNEQAALARTGGDRALLGRIAALFHADARRTLASIDRALAARDVEGVRLAAHALKGSAATVGAEVACRTAAELEERAREAQLDGGRVLAARLHREIDEAARAFVTARVLRPRAPTRARGATGRPRRRSRPSRRRSSRS